MDTELSREIELRAFFPAYNNRLRGGRDGWFSDGAAAVAVGVVPSGEPLYVSKSLGGSGVVTGAKFWTGRLHVGLGFGTVRF